MVKQNIVDVVVVLSQKTETHYTAKNINGMLDITTFVTGGERYYDHIFGKC